MNLITDVTRPLKRRSNQYFHDYQEKLSGEATQRFLSEVLDEASRALSLSEWEAALGRWNEVKAHLDTHFELVQLAFQRFTEDPTVEAEEKRLREEVEPVYSVWNAKVREKFLASPERAALEAKYGSHYFAQLQIAQDAFDPQNVALETKINEVLAEYTKLTGSAFFEIEGKKYPLAHIKKFSASSEPKLRRESYQSYSAWFLNHKPELEGIFDRLVGFRDEMGKTLGHSDFIPLAYQKMRRLDYDANDVAALREQIREVLVPMAAQIRKSQAKDLSSEKVKVWDMDYFPAWKLGEMKVEIKDQPAAALRIYESLSPKLGAHFRRMMDWDLIDLSARPGKAPGAFCTGFYDYRVPYIFLNSVGESSDLTTLLHECGHSFQAWESRDIELIELSHPTLEACEVHSMGMEFLAHPYYEEFYSAKDAELLKRRHLAESILILPYIAMVDEFQHRVYSGEAKGEKGREAAWKDLEEKYGPGVDFGDLEVWKSNRWLRQLHIFQVPFYYIDYAIAQIGAWQLWAQSLEDKAKAMDNYIELCRLGGTLPLKAFFKAGRLDLPFEPGMLKDLVGRLPQL